MTTSSRLALTGEQARAVVRAASLAPSIHNTQPWRWVRAGGGLDLYADPGRQLTVADPAARQLLLSCGAALLNARLAIRGLGPRADVTPCPAGDDAAVAGTAPAASLRIVAEQPQTDDERSLADGAQPGTMLVAGQACCRGSA